MTDTDFETRLARSLQARAEDAVEPFDASMIADTAIGATRPRSGILRMALAAAAVAALVVGTAGAIVVGGLLDPKPGPSVPVIASPDASSEASTAPEAGLIVYTRWRMLANGQEDCTAPVGCDRASVFVSNQDGSSERELFSGPRSEVLAMSPDGSSLLVRLRDSNGVDEIYLTDVNGSHPQLLDFDCELPCENWGFTISPDGSRLAYAHRVAGDDDADETVIAVMDMATGTVTELVSTFVSNPYLGPPCGYSCGPGSNDGPSWSPDGAHLLFSRLGIGIPNQPQTFGDKALFVVDVDGSNLHQLVPTDLSAIDARWSPDGSLIVFTSAVEFLTDPGVIDNRELLSDIYTVRPDGTGLQRLTTDTVGLPEPTDVREVGARFPNWTRDGRIVFTRGQPDTTWQLWVMDRDGSNQMQLDPSDAAALTAIGCVSCPYPAVEPAIIGYPSVAFWVPAQ